MAQDTISPSPPGQRRVAVAVGLIQRRYFTFLSCDASLPLQKLAETVGMLQHCVKTTPQVAND